jgi:hypothetical protein
MKNRLYLFWLVGRNVYNKQKSYENVCCKYSEYYSYKYGNSNMFSRDNLKYMSNFYCRFPMYFDCLNKLSWNHYRLILNINDVATSTTVFFIKTVIFIISVLF